MKMMAMKMLRMMRMLKMMKNDNGKQETNIKILKQIKKHGNNDN